MAGMEQLEIHSKSYLVRWINVTSHFTLSWSIQPHKKSINFGVFKHPSGAAVGASPNAQNGAQFEQTLSPAASTPPADASDYLKSRRLSSLPNTRAEAKQEQSTNAYEKLESLGMKAVAWTGRCEADRVSMGSYDVPDGEGGMYGLVFDNTHSKQLSKTVTVVLMAYPTSAPPKSGHIHLTQALSARKGSTNSPGGSPALRPIDDLSKVAHRDSTSTKVMFEDPRPRSKHAQELTTSSGTTFFTGVLSKKRRKRNQGYARRFFSLDFTSSTLSYFKSRDSLALRGSIPLALAVIGANEKTRQISVDSGAEIWLLKANHRKDFDAWKQALERASQSPGTPMSPAKASPISALPARMMPSAPASDEREWAAVENLVGKAAGIRDALRRLAQDTDPSVSTPTGGLGISNSGSASPSESAITEYFDTKTPERPSFWRRKSSSSRGQSPSLPKKDLQATTRGAGNSLAPPSPGQQIQIPKRQETSHSNKEQSNVHSSCMALLKDLDSVVAEFSSLIAEKKSRRTVERPQPVSRLSGDSSVFQEFFDADDGSTPQLLKLGRDSEEGDEEDEAQERDDVSIATGSESSDDEGDQFSRDGLAPRSAFFPAKAKSLSPLPKDAVARRNTVQQSVGSPPSLISFLRKNVGKDLTTIAMPVTANEPLSLLQRQAEELQHSELLDAAAASSTPVQQRILYVAAFAISALSAARAKERAIRKPFNPMLGETYEMVREDKGFRFLAEKVSHRPVRVACQAESATWTFTFAPAPSQKFWGKSAELIVHGRARVVFHASGLCYSWTPATCFLRNIIAGEKYVEPVQTFTVVEETTGEKAIVSFKAGGMFSGRSEDVTVQAYDGNGNMEPLGLQGKWTSFLKLTASSSSANTDDEGKEIWRAGPLIANPGLHYGLTEFAAGLNEITSIEDNALPPTDSRLRPDQRAYENGTLDEAEKLKLKLEEAQRRRRKEMETSGETWEPRWFEKVGEGEDNEEVWRLKDKEGYWDVRAAVVGFKGGKWDGVREVFDVS